MIDYRILKHRAGVRRYDLFKAPRFSKASTIQLPFGGILHYNSDNPEDLGPSLDNQFLKGITKPIFIDYVTTLTSFQGNPRLLSVPAEPLIRLHARNNRMMRPLRNPAAAYRDPKSILIENYCLMDRRYRYVPGLRSVYNRWVNTWSTVLAKAAEVAKEAPDRPQFIQIDVPTQFMSLSDMKRAENMGKGLPVDVIKRLQTPDRMTILDLFLWLGPYREMSILSMLESEMFKCINLCFIEAGCWTFINLEDLDRWRETPKDEIEKTLEQTPEEERESVRRALMSRKGSPVAPKTLQKDLLGFLLQIAKLRVASVDDRVANAVMDTDVADEQPQIEEVKKPIPTKDDTVELNPSIKDSPVSVNDNGNVTEADPKEYYLESVREDELIDVTQVDDLIDESEKRIADFDALTEELNLKVATQVEEKELEDDSDKELKDYVIDRAEDLVQRGIIEPAAYKRSVRLADRYATIPNPVPGQEGTLEDLIRPPTKEELVLPEKNPITSKKIEGVTDESMLYNTKDKMDQMYLKNLHHKNMARMVMSVQKSGVAVQNYKIDRVDNYMDSYEVHTVKLVPVTGTPSTISFKVPVIQDDGSYRSGGIRYRFRTQRTD